MKQTLYAQPSLSSGVCAGGRCLKVCAHKEVWVCARRHSSNQKSPRTRCYLGAAAKRATQLEFPLTNPLCV